MKVKDIIKQITDYKLYIEIIDNDSNASYGFNTKDAVIFQYNDRIKNAKVKNINCQYIDGNRVLILKIDR